MGWCTKPLYGQGSGGCSGIIDGAGEDTSQSKQGGCSAVGGDIGEFGLAGCGEVDGSEWSANCGDGAGEGEGEGEEEWSFFFKKEDSLTSLTLPKTELSRPRFLPAEPVIVWANCLNLWGKRLPKPGMTEAWTTTGGAIVEPFSFVICTYTFCQKKSHGVRYQCNANNMCRCLY